MQILWNFAIGRKSEPEVFLLEEKQSLKFIYTTL